MIIRVNRAMSGRAIKFVAENHRYLDSVGVQVYATREGLSIEVDDDEAEVVMEALESMGIDCEQDGQGEDEMFVRHLKRKTTEDASSQHVVHWSKPRKPRKSKEKKAQRLLDIAEAFEPMDPLYPEAI